MEEEKPRRLLPAGDRPARWWRQPYDCTEVIEPCAVPDRKRICAQGVPLLKIAEPAILISKRTGATAENDR